MDTNATSGEDVADIIEIRDPAVDVNALMATIRSNVARRRAEGAYNEDLDAIAAEVFAGALAAQPFPSAIAEGSGPLVMTLAELNTHWMVHEVPFTSDVPVLGRVIVALRSAWNWMSAKWYVRPIVQQLVGFNALVVRAFTESISAQQKTAEEVHELQIEIGLLREEIERLRGGGSAENR